MRRFQEIHFRLFSIDIEDVMTISSLSLKTFISAYYKKEDFLIHSPTPKQDSFIRRAYSGGHVDVYKPYGEDLYHYDVNSLYPFGMKTFPMPEGEPVWRKNLEKENLETLFAFVEALIFCPDTIKRPLLPLKSKDGTLIFPRGVFVGVYFTEELKLAKSIG